MWFQEMILCSILSLSSWLLCVFGQGVLIFSVIKLRLDIYMSRVVMVNKKFIKVSVCFLSQSCNWNLLIPYLSLRQDWSFCCLVTNIRLVPCITLLSALLSLLVMLLMGQRQTLHPRGLYFNLP